MVLLLTATFAAPLSAQDITPTDVYRETIILKEGLAQIGLLDIAKYNAEEDDTALRHPRHVMEKVRECHMMIGKIMQSRGIEVDDLPSKAEFNEVRPADVFKAVKFLQKDAQKLGQASVPAPVVEDQKVPTDVYNHLKRICHALQAEVKPADVYRVAQVVLNNVMKIAEIRGINIRSKFAQYEEKIPADVYHEAWAFLDDLRFLALNPDYAIPGGVILPNQRETKDIIPQDVIALMHDALAETEAIKYTLRINDTPVFPLYQEGKTPSDVYSLISHAHSIVRELLEMERREDEAVLK